MKFGQRVVLTLSTLTLLLLVSISTLPLPASAWSISEIFGGDSNQEKEEDQKGATPLKKDTIAKKEKSSSFSWSSSSLSSSLGRKLQYNETYNSTYTDDYGNYTNDYGNYADDYGNYTNDYDTYTDDNEIYVSYCEERSRESQYYDNSGTIVETLRQVDVTTVYTTISYISANIDTSSNYSDSLSKTNISMIVGGKLLYLFMYLLTLCPSPY